VRRGGVELEPGDGARHGLRDLRAQIELVDLELVQRLAELALAAAHVLAMEAWVNVSEPASRPISARRGSSRLSLHSRPGRSARAIAIELRQQAVLVTRYRCACSRPASRAARARGLRHRAIGELAESHATSRIARSGSTRSPSSPAPIGNPATRAAHRALEHRELAVEDVLLARRVICCTPDLAARQLADVGAGSA